MKPAFAAAIVLLWLGACSPGPADDAPNEAAMVANENVSVATAPEPAAPEPADAAVTPNTLTLAGLGALRIGQAVPAGSGWAERGAQVSDECRTISSPDFPGAYAIVEGGKVRRITVGERSDVKLAEDIGVGATEAEVRAAFPGFRESNHAYVDQPAKYLTAPNVAGGDPALRFEIGADARVSLVHIGTMPVLGYVEGCA